MKAFLFVLSLFAGLELFSAHDLTGIWESYKSLHGKSYESAKEETFRQKIWTENVAFIQKHNLEYDLGLHTYTVGLNQFSDWTTHEYGRYMLGARPSNASTTFNLHQAGNPSNLPSQIDWRKYGYVTPVKNQGQCGSCWAFSSTGSLEGQTFRKYGQLISLSEQNLVDCTRDYGNRGCNGGWMYNAFKYIINNKGLDREECYPYEGKDLACRYKPSCTGAYVTNYVNVAKGSEPSLQDAVGTVGPVSVAIDANHPSFMQYKSGVFYEPKCSSTTSDHAVLVVGYGREDGNDYWLVKNSWSASWGEQGYIKMSRNRDNNCAIATYATYPVV